MSKDNRYRIFFRHPLKTTVPQRDIRADSREDAYNKAKIIRREFADPDNWHISIQRL